jgi:hypothetical protein
MKFLRDVLPKEALDYDEKFSKFLDVEILRDGVGYWPGPHKHVYAWWILKNGYCVGWNENPGRGWSFSIFKMRKF